MADNLGFILEDMTPSADMHDTLYIFHIQILGVNLTHLTRRNRVTSSLG